MSENTMSWADLGLGDLDLSKVEAASGFVDKVGEGIFQCITQQMVLGSKDGTAYARLDYEVATGEKTGEQFQEMFWNIGDPDAASRGFLKKRMLSLGMPESQTSMPDPEAFSNIPVVVTRKAKPKDGKTYYNVVDVELYQKSEEKPVETPKTNEDLGQFFG